MPLVLLLLPLPAAGAGSPHLLVEVVLEEGLGDLNLRVANLVDDVQLSNTWPGEEWRGRGRREKRTMI